MKTVIEAKSLTKAYGDFTAVDQLSFSLEEGKIYGLLGRNGAGKTTLMHMITAQQFQSSGELLVFGERPYENNAVLSNICFIKESQKYPDNFTVKDVLQLAPHWFKNWDAEYAAQLVEKFRLPIKRRVKKLSRGLLSSVGIVVGLASRAPLTIFDEPYLGLDATARAYFYDELMEDYVANPRTVILSTHLIDEVSKLLEHILLLHDGKILVNEPAESLRGGIFTVNGPKQQVEDFTRSMNVIDRQLLGSFARSTVHHSLSEQESLHAKQTGLEIESVSLQQLIVHLTSKPSNGSGEVSLV